MGVCGSDGREVFGGRFADRNALRSDLRDSASWSSPTAERSQPPPSRTSAPSVQALGGGAHFRQPLEVTAPAVASGSDRAFRQTHRPACRNEIPRNREPVEQLQARNAQVARLSHLEATARESGGSLGKCTTRSLKASPRFWLWRATAAEVAGGECRALANGAGGNAVVAAFGHDRRFAQECLTTLAG